MMANARQTLISPPQWDDETLDAHREASIQLFREERIREPLETYLEVFEEYQVAFEELLETTVDLTKLHECAQHVFTDSRFAEAVRYLPGPPISADDLRTLAAAPSIAPKQLRSDPELAKRLVETVLLGLDRRRFPWLGEEREATEHERDSAILASAALLASKRVETLRRNEGKQGQESRVRQALLQSGFKEVPTKAARTLAEAPALGEFCQEALLGSRKADLIARLWDGRVMPIECKVSNSGTNSIKRLNNDAAVKAETWRSDFGSRGVVPVAVLSGVFNLHNLRDAQQRGLALFWAHDLGRLIHWIEGTRV